jgi:lipopolysaccharide transport system ATP-binding protein
MSSLAISVRNLGKRYRLGRKVRYRTLRDSFVEAIRRPFQRTERDPAEIFWALKDISFDVRHGDIVGIIGRNGAGKSTLLKILSNVTEPTEGEASIWGRLGSLLEVGTGFHPELTGRENIYLSGAILGMPKAEIARRFDEIVAFAEVERFLDTPAKRYSSGMYLRLAFSVAAHLEPDILVVDEVLAVGDANFQKKCLGKMEAVGREGRTVLFVSHSMPTVLRLCRSAMLLENGKQVQAGNPHEVVSAYLQAGSGVAGERVWADPATAPGDEVARLKAVRVLDDEGQVADSVDIRRPVTIEVDFWHGAVNVKPSVNIHFYNDDGVCLFVTNDFNAPAWKAGPRKSGVVRSRCHIPGNFLAEGRVILRFVAVSSYNPTSVHALERDAVSFQVVDKSEGDGVRGEYANEWPGVVRPWLEWTLTDDPR